MSPRSDLIAPTSIAAKTSSPASYGDPGGEDEFAAAINLGSKLFDVLLDVDDLFVGITHLLGLLDRPQPRRSSDAAGVPMSSPNDPCSNPIRECMLPDQFGKPIV